MAKLFGMLIFGTVGLAAISIIIYAAFLVLNIFIGGMIDANPM